VTSHFCVISLHVSRLSKKNQENWDNKIIISLKRINELQIKKEIRIFGKSPHIICVTTILSAQLSVFPFLSKKLNYFSKKYDSPDFLYLIS
jgi:hypothetical protein